MADPNRDPDAVRRDRTDPMRRHQMNENDTDLDSGPDRDLDEDEDTDIEDEQRDRTMKP
jgi:hypothetical protein